MATIEENHSLLLPEFEKVTDIHTDTTIKNGNTITLLPSGVSSYEMRWKLIENARHHIDIVAFSLMKDPTGYRFRDALLKKLQQNVKVRLIFDDAPMFTTFSGGILKELEIAGAETIRYDKVFRDCLPDLKKNQLFQQLINIVNLKLKRRFHEKYMIVDGREVILGGINWGDKYAFGGLEPKAWRDTDIHITGPIVADIQKQFIHDFYLYTAYEKEYGERDQPGFDKKALIEAHLKKAKDFIEDTQNARDYFPEPTGDGDIRARYIPHKPYDENRLPLTEAYLLMFKEAKKFIFWGCHGIRPPRVIAEALAEAVSRGVEVHLITNSKVSSRTLMGFGLLGWMYWESSHHFPWLIEHGIHVYEWQKPGAFHSKNLLIDDVVASVGSYNIARGSTFYHTESNVIIYGGELPLQVHKQFEIDLQDCRELTIHDVKKVNARYDPFLRPLEKRSMLISKELLTPAILADLEKTYPEWDTKNDYF